LRTAKLTNRSLTTDHYFMPAASVETVSPRATVKPRLPAQRVARFRAPFSLRCGAILIDYILLTAIIVFSTLISRLQGGGARSAGSITETFGIILAFLIAALDLGVLPGLTGLTVGKWATGLRILRADGRPIGIVRAFLRHFVGYPISFVLFGIGFIIAALSQRGRGLHDIIADTIVVREGPAMAVRVASSKAAT
jgi:uncharacterized RDD family membrane protein YckC